MTVIGATVGGAVVGGLIGLWTGERGGGDYSFAGAIYGPLGAAGGAIAGCVLGVVLPHVGVSWH